jgi:hypothetical protein
MAYLSLSEFKLRTTLPAEYVDAIETAQAGWIAAQLESWSKWIDARLRKRYAAPFSDPYPEAVLSWLGRIVTLRCMLRRGVDATDAQFIEIKADADAAVLEVKEAADSETGLFDLPLLSVSDTSAIVKGGPFCYSEQSPYVAFDAQRETGRDEDRFRGGTFG